ncbi:MAG: bifunctional riboflavin kinase/FAD synthetase [Prolixibacteraceae bacterium]|nr:bifunctional riboflavin kinase/FAD synthetase [Prolixibacteraceae bacterium]
MIVHQGIDGFIAKNPVITIGTFDGVHLGHRKVIDQLNSIAQAINGESVLFTFYPHPRLVISPDNSNLRLITTLDEKTRRLEKAGIDHMMVYPFTKEFAALSYEEFIEEVLIKKMGMKILVVGHDHRLGKNREGSFENIIELSKKLNFEVRKIEALLIDAVDISSSIIRNALQKGEVDKVKKYLGYAFTINGKVATGNQIGRKISFPTANIETTDPHKIIPAEGVYAITLAVNDKIYRAMLNIGIRPTIDTNADHRTIEAHIFDFNEDIYGQEVTICFHHRIRDEKKFDGLNDLKTQLKQDQINVIKILAQLDLSCMQ